MRSYKDRPDETRAETAVSVTVVRDETAIQAVKERLGWRIYATNDPDARVAGSGVGLPRAIPY